MAEASPSGAPTKSAPHFLPASKQRGAALLLLMFVLFMFGMTVFFTVWNGKIFREKQEQKLDQALQQAKEAIIAWSVTHPSHPGLLPCPEDTGFIGNPLKEGEASAFCSNTYPQIGRIAWRTLKLEKPADASGESFWYVLSPGFRSTPPPGVSGVPEGKIKLDDIPVVAIIIAPGPPLSGQNRPAFNATSPPLAANYLDMVNKTGPNFISNGPPETFNDRLVAITSQELFHALRPRVLREILDVTSRENGLCRYFDENNNTFPLPGMPLSNLFFDSKTAAWLKPGGNPDLWFSLVFYQLSPPKITLGGREMDLSCDPI